ncbi:hypothetical protein JRQ81_017526, partial [Phrynocephalus forsythii]
NINRQQNIAFVIMVIKDVGRHYAQVVLRKADVNLTKRASEYREYQVECGITIRQNP